MKIFLFLLLSAVSLFAGPVIDLTNTEGASFEAEIISLNEEQTTVRRTSDQRVFTLSLTSLSEGTRTLLKENADLITDIHPDYEFDVVVGKRRRKDGSSFMVEQTLTCKVGIKNESRELDSPGVKVRMLLIGQNQRYPDKYEILSAQDFEVTPKKTETANFTLKDVTTRYDSDNEGEGNIGGYQYEDYVLIMTDQDGKLLRTKTLNTNFEKALASQAGVIEKLMKASDGTELTEDLKIGD